MRARWRRCSSTEDDLHLDLRTLSFRFVFAPPGPPKSAAALESYRANGSGTVLGVSDHEKQVQIEFWQRAAEEGFTDERARASALKFRAEFDALEKKLAQQPYLMGGDLSVLDMAWLIYEHRLSLAGYPFARLHPRVRLGRETARHAGICQGDRPASPFAGSTRRRPPRPGRQDIGNGRGQLVDMRHRIKATRWPDRETVPDESQGIQLATIQGLAQYWATGYDWRKCEARLNSYPQFITEIDGLDIHFIHVRSKHENAMPLIVTHGWPGSIIEQFKIIDPLVNPTAYGAPASDAFHLVIPSLPGYGFSARPTTTGWGPERTARAWVTLMKRLGYERFASQGGDLGGIVTNIMAKQAPPELIGIHVNSPARSGGY